MSSDNTKVALVDDDPAMLRILSAWLKKAGYQVQTFDDARLALTSIEENPPDFLITDWEMPHMTGIELCHRVRELKLSQYIYTVFLTVKSAPKEMIEGLEIGADDFLSKPVHEGELMARIRAGARIIELERRLGMLARTDYLTGLMTQRVFYESLDKEWSRAERSGAPLSCVMMDIDYFKKVNDVHGHPAGDAVLRAVADLLRKNSRATDIPCRYGGEEFCILLPETDEESALQWAERIRQQLAATTVSAGGHAIGVTGSFGVAQRHDDTTRGAMLVDQADQALLQAKQSGRDRVVCFTSLGAALGGGERVGRDALFAGIEARHVMSPEVVSLTENNTIGEAADYFLRTRTNSSCVVDADGRLAGILSEKDLLTAMTLHEAWRKPLGEVMKSNVICFEQDTPLQTIYQFLCRVSIRRVVIISEGKPIGTISRGTLLRWFQNLATAKGFETVEDAAGTKKATDARHHLVETARRLASLGDGLLEQTELAPTQGTSARLAGQAAQIEDLLNDLLACSAASQAATDGVKSADLP